MQSVAKRKLPAKSKGLFTHLFDQSAEQDVFQDGDDPKTKNIRQTELLIDLHNAVLQVCKHFQECPERHEGRVISTQADYSSESQARDREIFFKTRREAKKRARALLDFEKQEEDELGFSKNAIITVLDHTKDEHCWIGELNGQRGWFPAKFVEVIDERGKNYCSSGDEAVDSTIASMVRGPLAMVFRRILLHGMRSSSRMHPTFVPHAWAFIGWVLYTRQSEQLPFISYINLEAVAHLMVERHNPVTNSKLSLCDTFRLDEDKKILSPEELLLRAVRSINVTHSLVSAQMDMKLRSLLVYGLNEQASRASPSSAA